MDSKKKQFLSIVCFSTMFFIVIFSWYFGLFNTLTLDTLKHQSDTLKAFTDQYFAAAVVTFVVLYTAVVIFSLPGAAIFSLAGGFLFGVFWGTILNVFSATAGALGSFLLTRFLIGDYLQKKFSKQLAFFNQELSFYGMYYLMIVRLLPIFPFFLVNILCGLTVIPLKKFFITTLLGIVPGALVYTYAGSQLAFIQSNKDIFSKKVLFGSLILAFFIFSSFIGKRLWQRSKIE